MKKMPFVIPRCVHSIFSIRQAGYFKKLVVALLFVSSLLTSVDGWGQIIYQSKTSGNWDDANTWLVSTNGGVSFDDATVFPERNNNEGTTIQATHNVTVTANLNIDQVSVDGILTVNGNVVFRVYNSTTNPDLKVGGTVNNSGTITGQSSDPAEVEITGSVTNLVEGVLNGNNLTITFGSTGKYNHNRDGNNIPLATWADGSSCSVTGIISNRLGNTGQSFSNFSWNCPSMGSNSLFGNSPGSMEVTGTFEVISTGGSQLRLNQSALKVGDFRQTGGTLRISSAGAPRSLDVTGDFSMSGGTLLLCTGTTGVGVLNINNDFNHSGGTISETGSGNDGTINFTGTSAQDFTGGGTYFGTIDFNVAAGATLNLAGSADFSGSSGLFTNNGTITGEGFISIPSGQITEPTTGSSLAALINEGTIAPGNSPGTIFILGALISTGTLSMEVSSTAHDIINVTGIAILIGSLEVTFIDGFVPTVPPDVSYDLIQVGFGLFLLDFTPAAVSVGPAAILTWDYGLAATGAAGRLTITSVLPIDLVSFTGKRIDNTVELNWRTATEENNDFMAVERSIDGTNFTEIGRVKGVGTTQETQDYEFIDESPSPGANYYRLRQVDYDGAFEYHNVIFVDFIEQSTSKLIKVFPNPATERMRVSWEAGDNTITELRVFNMTGQLLGTYEVNGENGTYELPVQNLASGTYRLQLRQGKKIEAIPFIKQ